MMNENNFVLTKLVFVKKERPYCYNTICEWRKQKPLTEKECINVCKKKIQGSIAEIFVANLDKESENLKGIEEKDYAKERYSK